MCTRETCISPKAAGLILDAGEKCVYSVMHSFGLTVHVLVHPAIEGRRGSAIAYMCVMRKMWRGTRLRSGGSTKTCIYAKRAEKLGRVVQSFVWLQGAYPGGRAASINAADAGSSPIRALLLHLSGYRQAEEEYWEVMRTGRVCAQRGHSAHMTRRNWGVLLQLAIFLPIQIILHPHNVGQPDVSPHP